MESEVARLLAQISAEYEAAERGLTGFAQGNARHDFITQRMESMSYLCTELRTLVDNEEEAMKLVSQVLDKPSEDDEA